MPEFSLDQPLARMPRYEKWLTDIAPQAPADKAARRAIAVRLSAVQHYLQAATSGRHEAEAIHQLRIWTRRAAAAIRFFQPAIGRKPRRRMMRVLRRIRRTAGGVRDCDVHLTRLQASGHILPGRVLRSLHKERRTARQAMKGLERRLDKNHADFSKAVRRLIERIAWPKRHSFRQAPPLADWCRERLAPIAEKFFELAATDLADFAALHALRIAGKQLRYALELTPSVMTARLHQAFYKRLNELQDRLGEACDQQATVDQLRRWQAHTSGKKKRRKLEALLDQEAARLEKLQAKLLAWWSPARRNRLAAKWNELAGNKG